MIAVPGGSRPGGAPVVLVTGGRRGIGLATARALGEDGWHVALNDLEGGAVEEAAASLGGATTAHPADVAVAREVESLFDDVYRHHGRLDALVANAASVSFMPLVDTDPDTFRRSVEVNLLGSFHCLRAAARRWVDDRREGTIVTISSVSAHQARPGHGSYGASKAGVEMLTKVAAMELAPHGIRVNAVAPGGPILTELIADLSRAEGLEERVRRSNPSGRAGRPEEVASAVRFLVSEEASYVTGAVLVVDGGVSLGRP